MKGKGKGRKGEMRGREGGALENVKHMALNPYIFSACKVMRFRAR